MDYVFSIGTPVLKPNQAFRYRYRLLPNGAFSSWVTTTTNGNNTITGLIAGQYELEIYFVRDVLNEVVCPSIIRPFELVENLECLDWSASIAYESENYYMQINWSGSVSPPAPCGYRVRIGQLNQPPFINNIYPTLGAVPNSFFLPPGNADYYVIIDIQSCSDPNKFIPCYEEEINYTPDCEPFTGVSAQIVIKPKPNGTLGYYLKVNFTQSNPVTLFATTQYQQDRIDLNHPIVTSGVPEPTTTPNGYIPSTATYVEHLLKPNMNLPVIPYGSPINEVKVLVYKGWIQDGCGEQHPFTAVFPLS